MTEELIYQVWSDLRVGFVDRPTFDLEKAKALADACAAGNGNLWRCRVEKFYATMPGVPGKMVYCAPRELVCQHRARPLPPTPYAMAGEGDGRLYCSAECAGRGNAVR